MRIRMPEQDLWMHIRLQVRLTPDRVYILQSHAHTHL